MSRLIFEARRRLAPPTTRKGTIAIEAPPELPRVIPPSFLRRAMPFVIVILIVGMIVALVATGMRVISPQTLFFPFVLLLAATALYRGNDNKMRTEEVDAERADYLRYLSVVRDNIRTQAAQQRAAAQWSHPEPAALASIAGSRRQWERDPHDPDFLVVRAGRDDVPLDTALRVKDTADEVDLEPVSHSALRSLLDTQRTVADVPAGIDLTKVSRITVLGEADEVRAALRAWIAQAVTWHDPTVLGVALATRDLEGRDWSWLKWLPHVDIPGEIDGVGPARYLSTNPDELVSQLGSATADRPSFTGEPADTLRHLLIVVDDPEFDVSASALAVGRAGVTVVHRGTTEPNREQYSDPEKPILRIADGAIERWQTGGWQVYIGSADGFGTDDAGHLARQLSRWDSNPTHTGLRSAATRGASFTTLLGISDASQLDVPTLWAPRRRDDELRVPIGVTTTGEPLIFDLKDEAEGGMGPHGLMIGMTGSGKSQTLMSILLALLTTHPADRLIVIYADFKGEAGADSFRNFPQVVAVISNMAEKKSLADRFADTLRGEVARRETLLREAGRRVQGSAFNSVVEYENAIAAGHDLPPIPTLFVVADEFTLMLADYPEYAELFDYVARKGRSFRIHILFASQTLDVGKIKDIDKNTSYRVGLKVASPSVSRQIIGVEDAYHIESGKEHKGAGFLVPAPGAAPIKFRSTYVDGIYDPPHTAKALVVQSAPEPKLFPAGWVEPDQGTVISGSEEEADGRTATQVDRHHRRAAGALRAAGASAVAAAAGRTDPTDRGARARRSATTAMALAAGRDRQAVRDAARPAGIRRDVGVRQRGDPRWIQVRQIDCAADIYPCQRPACTRLATSPSTAWTTAADSCGRWRIWHTSAASRRRWNPNAFAVPSASWSSCCCPASSESCSGTSTARPPMTDSARCSWSSTTCTRSDATTPTSSALVTRCWPR